jgi:hypothetical protein
MANSTTPSVRASLGIAPTTAREAINRGLSRYFTGEPCELGHVAKRDTMDRCVVCETIAKQRATRLSATESIFEYRTAALAKARPTLTTEFRKYVMAMSSGDRIEWKDMDTWTKAQRPFAEWTPDPHGGCYWDDPWNDFTVDCMVISEDMAKEGWLTPTSVQELKLYNHDRSKWQPETDEYVRTVKPPVRQREPADSFRDAMVGIFANRAGGCR